MIKYEFLDKALWFPVEKILAIADLHIGYEESLNRAGVFVPRGQFNEMEADLKSIFKRVSNIKEIVILGDLKHEFGRVLDQEWSDIRRILNLMKEHASKIVLVRGNHDKVVEGVLKKFAEIRDYYCVNGKFFMHGDRNFVEVLDRDVKMIVLGHMHPAVSIREGAKQENYKCFLVGNYKTKEMIVLPSFFPLVEGSDIAREESNLSLKIDLKNFRVYVPVKGERNVLDFGKLKNVGKLS